MYNLYNFEAEFVSFLQEKRVSSVTLKNYLSDFRHFWSWFLLTLKRKNNRITTEHDPRILSYITKNLLYNYKQFLILNSVPPKTTNRKLAVVRQFMILCQTRGWISKNPAKGLINVSLPKPKKSIISKEKLIEGFSLHLEKSNISPTTRRSYLGDIKHFLAWAEDTLFDSNL